MSCTYSYLPTAHGQVVFADIERYAQLMYFVMYLRCTKQPRVMNSQCIYLDVKNIENASGCEAQLFQQSINNQHPTLCLLDVRQILDAGADVGSDVVDDCDRVRLLPLHHLLGVTFHEAAKVLVFPHLQSWQFIKFAFEIMYKK